MMRSLQLQSSQFNDLYQKIKAKVEISDLKQAYLYVVDGLSTSIAELNVKRIDEHIEFIAKRGANPRDTVLLLNMLSHMAQKRMLPLEELKVVIKEVINYSYSQFEFHKPSRRRYLDDYLASNLKL